MADSTDIVQDTDQEMAAPDTTEEQISEEKAPSDIEELKKSVSEDVSKATIEVEEEEEYVLKDEAHEEEETPKEQETNGKENEKSVEESDGKEPSKTQDESLGSTVAKHYNSIPESGKDARRQSRIFHLRNFNNWVKSVLINEFLEKAKKTRRRYDEEINVLDLGCGKGGDLLKWQKGRVGHVICADIAETSVDQCKERYENMRKSQRQGGYRESRERLFSIECIPADCTKENISEKFKSNDMQLDLSSCQFAFHYSFESYQQADMMLRNACERLRPGGYFIGTTPDSYELVKRLKQAEGNSFGNEVYNVEFENEDKFELFGSKYHFKLTEVVDCPEFLVYFPTVVKLAEKYNMKLVYKKNFRDLFKEKNKDFGNLLHKMQALEPYPARKGWSLVSENEAAYAHIKDQTDESHGGREKAFGTLSKDEWEATTLYMAFAFEKIDPAEDARREAKEKAQKRAASPAKEGVDDEPSAKRIRSSDEEKAEGTTEAKQQDAGEAVEEAAQETGEAASEETGETAKEETSETATGETSEAATEETSETATGETSETAVEETEIAQEPEDAEMTDVAETKPEASTEENQAAEIGEAEIEEAEEAMEEPADETEKDAE